MSIQAIAWVLENSKSTGSSRLVLISYANHARKENNWTCWSATRTTKKEAGVSSHATVLTAAEKLEKLGEIEILDRGGPRTSMRVRLLFMDDVDIDERVPEQRSDSDHSSEHVCGHDLTAADSPDRPQRSAQADQNRKEPVGTEQTLSGDERPTVTAKEIRAVFDEWVTVTGRGGRTKLTRDRQGLIRVALGQYPLGDVLDAVRGLAKSSFHMGDNDRSTVYDELRYSIGKPDAIEKFRDLQRGVGAKPTGRPARGRPVAKATTCKRCGYELHQCTCPSGKPTL